MAFRSEGDHKSGCLTGIKRKGRSPVALETVGIKNDLVYAWRKSEEREKAFC